LPEQFTINVLGQLTAILGAEEAIVRVHGPDNVFMVLVSIFISNHNHFCLSASTIVQPPLYDVLKY